MDDGGRIIPSTDGPEPRVIAFPRSSDRRQVTFDRRELFEILTVYGRMVAAGEWRDYAIDHLGDRAVFSIFRRSREAALWRVEKVPALAARQGAYAVSDTGGRIVKRGHELGRVLAVLEKKPRLVDR